MLLLANFVALSLAAAVPAAPSTPVNSPGPLVTLAQGIYQGVSTQNGVTSSWLGIPYASALPIFNLPKPVSASSSTTINNATAYGPACYQQSSTAGSGGDLGNALGLVAGVQAMQFFGAGGSGSADECLSVNVITPAGQTAASAVKLPVVVWIYGGGFEFGYTSQYEGSPIVARSVATGSPVIYVSMNYRLNGFGFMAGKEIKAAGVGNLGLQDQREALRWVQKNIAAFGGDPKQVTIWGESAGAISVALQMINSGKANRENLYRAAFMESGSPIPMGQIDAPSGQYYYDFVVAQTNCTSSPLGTLNCLRAAPFAAVAAAIQKTPGILTYVSLNLAWKPRVDGVFFTQAPQLSTSQGDFPAIPFLNGDCEDEGTLFSVSQTNTTTDAQFLAYIKAGYGPTASDAEIATLGQLYPSDPAQGSPYNTSSLYAVTPQYKRIASFQGDVVFQATRRYFFSFAASTNNIWSYVYRRNKAGPLGSYHSSDLTTQFYASSYAGSADYQFIDYLVNFVTTLNPNTVNPGSIYYAASASAPLGSATVQVQSTNTNLIYWPQYSLKSPQMLTLLDRPLGQGLTGLAITLDTYRIAAINGLIAFSLKYGPLN